MADDYNEKSVDAVLSRIEQRQKDMGESLTRIESNQAQLWRAHTALKTKVAGIAAIAGLIVAGISEWIRSQFSSK